MTTEAKTPELKNPHNSPILALFIRWTPQERKQALPAMSRLKTLEFRSALMAAGWTPSDLIAAGWTPSDLRAAGWTPSDLIAAGWTPSDLDDIEERAKKDIQAKAKLMGREESEYVVYTLRNGLMNGSTYGTIDTCGCYLGSAAKRAGVSVEKYCQQHNIAKDGGSPAEQWFINVQIGDTPEHCYAAKRGVEWIEEVLSAK